VCVCLCVCVCVKVTYTQSLDGLFGTQGLFVWGPYPSLSVP